MVVDVGDLIRLNPVYDGNHRISDWCNGKGVVVLGVGDEVVPVGIGSHLEAKWGRVESPFGVGLDERGSHLSISMGIDVGGNTAGRHCVVPELLLRWGD